MKKILFTGLFLFISVFVYADAINEWSDFEQELRKGNLTAAEAEFKAKKLVPALSAEIEEQNIIEDEIWLFPVRDFSKNNLSNIKKIYPQMSSSVRDTKFLDGLEFLVQPYLRLEIRSLEKEKKKKKKNKEEAKAGTLKSAEVIAANNGIVVYIKKGAMNSPGGNTVWIYNPDQNFFIYYGMLRNVAVNFGDIVKTGDKIGTIIPTKKGYNLNFAVLMYGDEMFTLFNYLDTME